MHVDPNNNRHCYADDGMDITDIETETLRTKEVYLGINAEFDEYFKEIPEGTPIPDSPVEVPDE